MQKHAYLQFFKQKMSFKKQAQQSLDESWIIEDQPHNSPKNASGTQSVVTQQADTVESPSSDPSYSLQKQQFPKSFHFTDHVRKSHHIKNHRVQNKSSQAFKRKQSECNDQSQSKYSLNARKNFSQFHQKPLKSQQMKAVKFMTPNFKKFTPKNQSQIGKRLKTLQAPDILEQQKLFTQPIKPYDRNKTARNKKFRTLKTAFGDLNSSCRNYNDQYTMGLQNLRMGWRIVNTRSMIQEYLNSTYFTYHLYNGNMINKEKNKDKAQKEKRKINLKQMKNVYKVFFNQNIMFNKKQNKNPKIFQSIKEKDEVHDYVLNQSQMKLKSQSGFFSTPNDQQKNMNIDHSQTKNLQSRKSRSRKIRPCFFRKTYNQKDHSFNTKICEQQKYQKLSKSLHCQSSNFCDKSFHQTQPQQIPIDEDHYQMNEIFGKGNTIIQLRDIQLETCSPIKRDDLLVLQLMAQNGNVNTKKGVISNPLKYSQIKNGVKFAIDLKVGDFVPLKIWKYHGINLIELGIIDLNIIAFRNRKKYFDIENKIRSEPWSDGIQNIQLYRQERQSVSKKNRKHQRQILFYHTKEKLRKNKKAQIQISISLNCLIYSKKFTRQKMNMTENLDKENVFTECPDKDDDFA